ncbi:M23 family metallopeptidase [Qipengyuania sp. MTN3-11]
MAVRFAPLLGLAGCVPQSAEPEPAPPPVTTRAAPVVQPVATPSRTPIPAEPVRRNLAFQGQLEQGGWIRGTMPSNTVDAALGDTEIAFDEEGRFFAAFDRDQGPSIRLSARLESGETTTRDLVIAPREWDIERVNVARRPGGASEAFMARRMPELEAIYLARQKETGAQGWRQDFIWPATGRISGRFGSQRIYRGSEAGSYHSGIDIATGGSGSPFVAPADGVVVLAVTDFSLEGQLLIVDHGQGLNSAFLHASRLLVSEGEQVRQGQHIGDIGSSGRATGPHLHWSLMWRDSRLDPLLFTGPMR